MNKSYRDTSEEEIDEEDFDLINVNIGNTEFDIDAKDDYGLQNLEKALHDFCAKQKWDDSSVYEQYEHYYFKDVLNTYSEELGLDAEDFNWVFKKAIHVPKAYFLLRSEAYDYLQSQKHNLNEPYVAIEGLGYATEKSSLYKFIKLIEKDGVIDFE